MSVMTIQVSTEHVQALRESLLTARRALEEQLSPPDDQSDAVPARAADEDRTRARLSELDGLLKQLDSGGPSDSGGEVRELTGTRTALWAVVYDAACAASEQLAEELNEYWRGTVSAADTHARIADLGARFELLESLGPPPGE